MSKKILVSTIDAWGDQIGADTMPSLLGHLPADYFIASLNIRANYSDSPLASRYFHILEGRVLKSIWNPRIQTGEAYSSSSTQVSNTEVAAEEKLYGKKRLFGRYLYVLARELIWRLGRWKSRELDDFVAEFAPDVFFFPIESYIHFNRINEYIIRTFRPKKVIGYLWDDNFSYHQLSWNPLYRIHRYFLRRSIIRLVPLCHDFFVISQDLQEAFEQQFGRTSVVLTKPARMADSYEDFSLRYPLHLVYTGNLQIGRDETLIDVLQALQKVDKSLYCLSVYVKPPISPKIKKMMDGMENACLYCDYPQSVILQKQREADILLYLESLSDKNKMARLSFSSKLTDYFSAGKCIWAIGNKALGPMAYLQKEEAAWVTSDKHHILDDFNRLAHSEELLQSYSRKSQDCGYRNHRAEEMYHRVLNLIDND